jgi:hypothetical protein
VGILFPKWLVRRKRSYLALLQPPESKQPCLEIFGKHVRKKTCNFSSAVNEHDCEYKVPSHSSAWLTTIHHLGCLTFDCLNNWLRSSPTCDDGDSETLLEYQRREFHSALCAAA